MKTWLVALVASLIGVALGISTTVAEFWYANETFNTRPADAKTAAALPDGSAGKAVVIGSDHFEFGALEPNVKQSHEFQIRNDGTGPLNIKVGHTSCKCTVADLDKTTLRPGEITKVKLEWEGKGYEDEFSQSAEVITSDPDNRIVKLTIAGRIKKSHKVVPEEVLLSGISSNENASAQIRVFGYTDQPLEILKHSFGNPDQLDHYELAVAPLSPAEVSAEKDAKSGSLLTLTAKSGLPIGPIHQTIRLETNLSAAPLDIPIRGTVTSDISLVHAGGGKEFVNDKNLLRLGKLSTGQGAKVQLFLIVKGPHRNDTKINVESVDPSDVMQVTLGEPKVSEAFVRYPVSLMIPAGSPTINRQGGEQGQFGKVVFHTTNPVAKEVRLFVQFAIEN